MHTRVSFILDRLNADFEAAGLGPITLVLNPGAEWDKPVWAFDGTQVGVGFDDVESCIATLASAFQDLVIDQEHQAWPQVDGRPMWPSAQSGVACWHLDGKSWCAIGHLTRALAAHSASS
jgi:hypothetical protein